MGSVDLSPPARIEFRSMKRNSVSLCLIARDEEATIGMAIKSVLALVDEVIMVDTGSRDNTRIIAEGYGAQVLDVPWSDDFSAARNAALDQATGRWILVLDADEFLEPVRPIEFQRLLHDPAAAGYRLRIVGQGAEQPGIMTSRVRLFRNAPEVRYRYPIHERLAPSLGEWAQRENLLILDTDLTVMHERSESDRRVHRRERNQRILRKALAGYPEEPYFPYRLACEGQTLLDGEALPVAGLGSALTHLRTAWAKARVLDSELKATLSWLPDLGARLTSGLLAISEVDEAQEVVDSVSEFYPDHPLILLQSVAVDCHRLETQSPRLGKTARTKTMARARRHLDRIMRAKGRAGGALVDKRVRELYPLRYLGQLALREGKVTEAVGLFEQALSLDPTYSCGWLGLAECSRFAGDTKRALKLYLRTVTENPGNHRAWLRGCDLMVQMGFHDNAASWWRKVMENFPEHPVVVAASQDGCCEDLPISRDLTPMMQ
jgi:tetratricopeptide (TPR) repeat protein